MRYAVSHVFEALEGQLRDLPAECARAVEKATESDERYFKKHPRRFWRVRRLVPDEFGPYIYEDDIAAVQVDRMGDVYLRSPECWYWGPPRNEREVVDYMKARRLVAIRAPFSYLYAAKAAMQCDSRFFDVHTSKTTRLRPLFPGEFGPEFSESAVAVVRVDKVQSTIVRSIVTLSSPSYSMTEEGDPCRPMVWPDIYDYGDDASMAAPEPPSPVWAQVEGDG